MRDVSVMINHYNSVFASLAVLISLVPAVYSKVNASREHVIIWVVPHTHDDTGWLKTVDEYYVEEVHWILETVTQALLENPERRFTYVEMAYFYRWWNEIDDDMKSKVLHIIQNGQLQLNLAGWCMNDEADTHYAGVINQMTEGALFAMQQLKNRSTVGWHIDPFGHTSVTASLWADIGFNAFSISRINFHDLNQRKSDQKLEFVWRGSKSLGRSRDMWTHILDSHYCSPPECAYDDKLFLQDDPSLPSYKPNILDQAQGFVDMARERNEWYRHNNILIPFGCDFAHQNAEKSFVQMDELMAYVNSKSDDFDVTVRYGTLDDYARAINSLNLTWDVYEGDFLPYVSTSRAYWTGFYTSRPQLKGYVRSSSAFLQVAETLFSLGSQVFHLSERTLFDKIDLLRKAVGVSQHHDAITGTERSYVVTDYIQMMNGGRTAAGAVITDILPKFIGGEKAPPHLSLSVGDLLAKAKPGDKIAAVVYNSLGWSRQSYVSISVSRHDLSVVDSHGKLVPSDILTIPSGHESGFDTTLYFLAQLPPLGYRVYYIEVGHKHVTQTTKAVKWRVGGPAMNNFRGLENAFYKVNFSSSTGRMTSVFNKQTNKTLVIDQNLAQYVSATHGQASGAYIFRPARDNHTVIFRPRNSRITSQKLKFYEEFSEQPVVIMTANANSGLFSMSAGMVQGKELMVTAYKLDEDRWYDNISTNFWAFHPKTSQLGSQVGSWNIGQSPHTKCKAYQGKFPKSFSSTPRVVATVRMSESYNESYVVSAFHVTVHGASFNVCRTDISGWTQQLHLDWFAFEENAPFPNTVVHGSKVLFGGSRDQSLTVNIQLKNNVQIRDAAVLAMVTNGSHAFVVNSMAVAEYPISEFMLSVANVDLTSWTEDIRIDWMLFEKWTLQLPVADDPVTVHAAIGSYVSVIRQDFKRGYAQVFRVFGGHSGNGSSADQQYVEGEFQLGPIDRGREVITRFITGLHSNGLFYTDENGLEMKKRCYDGSQTEKIAGNYYPMVATSYLEDINSGDRLTLLSDRAHGCTSLFDGEIEVMMHRRCLKDDGYGLNQVLDDVSEIRAKLWMIFAGKERSSYLQRRLALLLQNPVAVLFANVSSPDLWSSDYKQQFSALRQELPPNIHLLSLQAVTPLKSDLILRLQHIFEVNDHPQYSKPVNISLSDLFTANFTASNPVEMSLTANVPRSVALGEQLKWKTKEKETKDELMMEEFRGDGKIVLSPRDILTFIINSS